MRGKIINEDHIDIAIRNRPEPLEQLEPVSKPFAEPPASHTLPEEIERLERKMITDALRETGGNKKKAADILGLSRQGLIKKLKRLAIQRFDSALEKDRNE